MTAVLTNESLRYHVKADANVWRYGPQDERAFDP